MLRVAVRRKQPLMLQRQAGAVLTIGVLLAFWLALVG